MPMSDVLALPFVSMSVGVFLDVPELASCEMAPTFSPCVFQHLWDVAALKLLERTPLWNNTAQEFVEKGFQGKRLVSGMTSWRRAVFPSKSWRPWIVETSFCSVKATPTLGDPHDVQSDETVAKFKPKPTRSSIAVAVGANRGENLVVGMKIAAAGPVNDNVCIAIEALGCPCSGRMMAISFAPFSGNCFIEHENGLTMQTEALPNIPEVLEVRVWASVTEKGDIRFFRQIEGGQVEDTGLLPHEMFPKWIRSYFAIMDIWFSDLKVAVDVSVEHSNCTFPTNMPVCIDDAAELETTWTILGEENW